MRLTGNTILGINTDVPSVDETDAMTDQQRKVLENRLRRAADRQGLPVKMSRRRDAHALGYGTITLVDARAKTVVLSSSPNGYGLGLEDVARHLYGNRDGR